MAKPPGTDPNTDAQIARIDALTANGRTNWFGLMAYLAFALITVLGVEDVDFFDPSRNTDLPLIGVAIPTFSFFIFAPILGAALYVYLHLTLRKATEALCNAPHRIDDDALEERIKPWLLNDLVLRMRGTDADGRPAAAPRPLDPFATLSAIALIWLAGPALMALMWVRSWPAHDWALSLTIAAAFLVTVFAGVTTWLKLSADLGSNDTGFGELLRDLGLTVAAMVVLMTTLQKTHLGVPQSNGSVRLAPANLSGARLSVLPPDQADPVAARQRYRGEWCNRQGMPSEVCGSLPALGASPDTALSSRRAEWCTNELKSKNGPDACRDWFTARDDDFRAEWTEYRRAVIAALPKPDLSGRDLRGADLSGAELIGVNLQDARMEGADLSGAGMERANLREARMEGADLGWARMEGADLSGAGMERASLHMARMQGANLQNARMEGAVLSWARMEGANLSFVRMEEADLREAHLEGTDLQGARIVRADLSNARMEAANLTFAGLEGADLREARMEGVNLLAARMEGANLYGARMEGANLSGARMEGANLFGAQMANANWAKAANGASPVQLADLRGGMDLDQDRLSSLIGNAATLLPVTPDGEPNLYVPSCWAADPPGFEHLVAGQARYGISEDELRDPARGYFCEPGEVPRKTGTPWPVDADPPWGAQGAEEIYWDHWRRMAAWAADQPLGEPID